MRDLPSVELLQQRLATWCERYRVAGAAIGVMLDDETRSAAAGALNMNTGVAATPDSLFQIGSITKVFTTTMVMQLVDEGRIELDAPARKYLPNLRFADERATAEVTIRQLLTHTSGVDGDYFEDFGRGDDCVERYVEALSGIESIFAPGEMWSYCNAGFVVLGRILEVLEGKIWDAVLRERIIEPLGLRHMTTLPEEALMFRAAAGHTFDAELRMTLAPRWDMPRAQAPAGSTPCATVDALLAFARMHIDGGRASSGAQVLSRASVEAMQEQHATLPAAAIGDTGWGLGWMLFDWDGRRVIGHDGGTMGQNSSLRVLPEARIAVSVVTNTDYSGGLLAHRAMRWIFEEVAGVEAPERPRPPDDPPQFDLGPYAGTYSKIGTRVIVSEREGSLWVKYEATGPLPSIDRPARRMVPVTRQLFLQEELVPGVWSPVAFARFNGDRPDYVFVSYRLARRVG